MHNSALSDPSNIRIDWPSKVSQYVIFLENATDMRITTDRVLVPIGASCHELSLVWMIDQALEHSRVEKAQGSGAGNKVPHAVERST